MAMESTGVYWKPIYAILEGVFEIVVANAQHVKKVPGRKTDVKDAEWIADLLCHGLLRPSFVPPSPIRELRDLTRYRRKLVDLTLVQNPGRFPPRAGPLVEASEQTARSLYHSNACGFISLVRSVVLVEHG